MSCRSAEKVLCPYCGAEMEIKTAKYGQGALGWAMCRNENCSAEGPLVSGKTMEKAVENARAAALRRYAPPITAENKLVCPINGAPCSECMPGSPCGVEVINDA